MGLKLAIVGATGLVGQELLSIIDAERPQLDRLGLYASEASAGSQLPVRGETIAVSKLDHCDFGCYDAAFFCVGDELSARYVPAALDAGCAVVDKSNAFRLSPDVPLVVAGVNDSAITAATSLVANPNCTTIVLVHALAPLSQRFGLEAVYAATYQSVTGAGRAGGEQLREDLKLAQPDTRTGRLSSAQADGIAYNVQPRIGNLDEAGRAGEEAKLVHESRKILRQPALPLIAHAVRVPVLVGHSIAVTIQLQQHVSAAELQSVWQASPDLRFMGEELPTPVGCATHDQVELGRLRAEADLERCWSFFVCGDNLRIGAALNGWRLLRIMEAVQLLPEFAAAQGVTDG